MHLFTPHHREDGPIGSHRLLHYYTRDTGLTVLKVGGQYRVVEWPTELDLEAAEVAYVGGHTYAVSDSEAASLTAAGFTTRKAGFGEVPWGTHVWESTT